jgi:5-methylcytosine-specific restriction endonuclease McrA
MREKPNLEAVSDDALLRGVSEILKTSRRAEAELVAHIAEIDARRLYAREAAPSMFAWCTETLHLSESEAYLRIAVARASRRHPMLLAMLADGRLHLSGIERLAPHLTERNRGALLKRAVHKSKRQIEELVAELAPRPAEPPRMRKLPARRLDPTVDVTGLPELRMDGLATAPPELRPAGVEVPSKPAPRQPRTFEAVAPGRFRLHFDFDAEFRESLERLQALVRTSVPDGDLAKVIRLAVTRELKRLEARRFAKTRKPRKAAADTDTTTKSRHIPAAVRRAVHERDGGRCTYRDKHGRRCAKRHDLEFHHRKPFGRGGEHSPDNLALACKAHNALMAEQDYGREVMARFRRSPSRVSDPIAVSSSRTPHRLQGNPPGRPAVQPGRAVCEQRRGLSWVE